ncbi:GPW/gp25 family protein [Chelatococcus asaccharovorans]|uniref:IraD/Gp25-like domain-containing protein n=1 Tax=Chelatococcus asaccharovorans TaxID=28210 RepID=A0A2V3UCJ0_9HYPH|nr:GPW/gp25 family protein [Chelatococcus asaccharovorans]MBS7703319.1 GPW/gp25 family protein [Chelatococcus asaccharovorans]PXW61652.1 hypothetical protein C7450_103169 [Chelatococcus asaccharovorans]
MDSAGTNPLTGQLLTDWEHVQASIADILITPIGTRVMLRDYGSRLTDLIDQPQNRITLVDYVLAIHEALDRWEPRFVVTQVLLEAATAGHLTVQIIGQYRPRAHLGDLKVADVRSIFIPIQRAA